MDAPEFCKGADFLFGPGEKPKVWLAGGSLLSMMKASPVNDYDLFGPEPNAIGAWLLRNGASVKFANDRVANFAIGDRKVQVIRKHKFDSMQATIDAFDFTCISAAYDGDRFCCHNRFHEDAAKSALVINRLKFPLSTMKRALRYAGNGYSLCPVELGKICRAINELEVDWDSEEVGEEFYGLD